MNKEKKKKTKKKMGKKKETSEAIRRLSLKMLDILDACVRGSPCVAFDFILTIVVVDVEVDVVEVLTVVVTVVVAEVLAVVVDGGTCLAIWK